MYSIHFFRRLCWLDINLWNCYAARRVAEIAIGIEWRGHAYGSYFIDTTIHSYGCRRSKGYSGNRIVITVINLLILLWNIREKKFKMAFFRLFFVLCRNFYSSLRSVKLLSKNYLVNWYEISGNLSWCCYPCQWELSIYASRMCVIYFLIFSFYMLL